MNAPAPIYHLATRQHHQTGDATWVAPDPATGRGARVERTCTLCGAVKITALPDNGGGYRLWRRPNETAESAIDPGCGPHAPWPVGIDDLKV